MSDYFNLNEGDKFVKKPSKIFTTFKNKKLNKKLLILIIVLFAIPFTLILSKQNQDNRNFAAKENNISDLTNLLLQGNYSQENITASDNKERVGIAELILASENRKKIMLDLAKENPREFLLYAMHQQTISNLNPLIKSNIEKETKLKGEVVISILEDLDQKKSSESYQINLLDSQRKVVKIYNLHFADKIPNIKTGDMVSVNGFSLDDEFVVKSGNLNQAELNIDSPVRSSPLGMQKVLVMLVNFQDKPSEKISKNNAQEIFFDSQNSVANFYRANSYGKTDFKGDVVGYLTVPFNISECNSKNWTYTALEMAKRNGYDPALYNRLVFIASGDECTYLQSSTLGGNPSKIFLNSRYFASPAYSYRHATHEMGHSLGLSHANFLDCGDESIKIFDGDLPSACESISYGDPTDVMGSNGIGYQMYLNAPHREELGWLDDSQKRIISDDSIIELQALESNLPGLKSANIEIPGSESVYNLSYKTSGGNTYDESTKKWIKVEYPQGIKQGAGLHIWKQINQIYSLNSSYTQLLNLNPELKDFLNASFNDGKVFDDSLSGIKVTQINHDDNKAKLQIEFDKTICRRKKPDLSIYPVSQVITPGKSATYSLEIKNNDSHICPATMFDLKGITWWDSMYSTDPKIIFLENPVSLAPGESKHLSINITSKKDQIIGNYISEIQLSSKERIHSIKQGLSLVLAGEALGRVEVDPKNVNIEIDSDGIDISVKVNDANGQDITDKSTIQWSVPFSSYGTLVSKTGANNTFKPLKLGGGSIVIHVSYNGENSDIKVPFRVMPPIVTPTITPTITPTPQVKKITLYPIDDAYVKKTEPNKKFGKSKKLEVSGKPYEEIFLKFDTTPISGKKIIKSNLVLKTSDYADSFPIIDIMKDNSWSEKNLNYKNRPTKILFALYDFWFSKVNTNTVVPVPFQPLSDNKITLRIKTEDFESGAFYSKEAKLKNRPKLIIEYR